MGRAAQTRAARAREVIMMEDRAAGLNWPAVEDDLNGYGVARAGNMLRAEECRAVAGFYDGDQVFRSRVIMGRHGFGRGEYRYFSCPLPAIVQSLREALY